MSEHQSRLTFDQFCSWWWRRATNERRGQRLFNRLNETRPDLAEKLRGTQIDPFHNDAAIPAALQWIGERWTTPIPAHAEKP